MDATGPHVPGLAYEADKALLRVEGLRKTFPVGGGGLIGRRHDELLAVDGVSFDIARGETFGLVGESGCGKTTIARCLLRLIEPTSGSITFDGIDLLGLDPHALRRFRRRIQIVFQDTAGSLGSRMSVRSIVEEPLVIHGIGTGPERRARVDEMLNLVGIRPETASRKPHQFSGGQRQRIGAVRALILKPELVVLDEPISALDVSVDTVPGCPFQPRCPVGRDRERCVSEAPPLEQKGRGHWVACHFPGELTGPEAANATRAARSG